MGWIYNKKSLICGLGILGIIGLLFSGCNREEPELHSQTRVLMGTVASIKVIEEDTQKAKAAIETAFERIKEIEERMSAIYPKSEVYSFNEKAGQRIKVSSDLACTLEMALNYSRLTDGAFDVTIGPLSQLWGFSNDIKRDSPPSRKEIARAAILVGYKNLMLDQKKKEAMLDKKGMKIDLGGIAKGYAVEEAIKVLKEAGIKNGLVNIGGEVKVIGQNLSSKPWQIGVAHPRKKNKILTVLPLKEDMAVATSGDYERFFFHDGRRYHHILDPKSGYPANGCISVTIIAPSALVADILATAVFVLGEVAGMNVIEKLETVEAIIITDSEVKLSSGLQGRIKIEDRVTAQVDRLKAVRL